MCVVFPRSPGKFRQGENDPDPKTWKANFRCAMNSLPDIEEVKDRRVNRGCGAVRVYRMLHITAKTKGERRACAHSHFTYKPKQEYSNTHMLSGYIQNQH